MCLYKNRDVSFTTKHKDRSNSDIVWNYKSSVVKESLCLSVDKFKISLREKSAKSLPDSESKSNKESDRSTPGRSDYNQIRWDRAFCQQKRDNYCFHCWKISYCVWNARLKTPNVKCHIITYYQNLDNLQRLKKRRTVPQSDSKKNSIISDFSSLPANWGNHSEKILKIPFRIRHQFLTSKRKPNHRKLRFII